MVWVGVESVSRWLLEGQLLPNSVEAVCVKASMYPWIHNKPPAHLLQRLYELHDEKHCSQAFLLIFFYMKNKGHMVTGVFLREIIQSIILKPSSLHICSPQTRVRTLPGYHGGHCGSQRPLHRSGCDITRHLVLVAPAQYWHKAEAAPSPSTPTSQRSDFNITLFVVVMVTVIELIGCLRPAEHKQMVYYFSAVIWLSNAPLLIDLFIY